MRRQVVPSGRTPFVHHRRTHMHLASHRVMRRAAARAGLLALVVGAAFGLTQCVQVTDPITGTATQPGSNIATFSHQGTDKCFEKCAKDFAKGVDKELKLHQKNKQDCNHDPVCLALERCRQEQAMDDLEKAFRDCRKNCHHQGKGHGGDDDDH
jgi:hypothetical protein